MHKPRAYCQRTHKARNGVPRGRNGNEDDEDEEEAEKEEREEDEEEDEVKVRRTGLLPVVVVVIAVRFDRPVENTVSPLLPISRSTRTSKRQSSM